MPDTIDGLIEELSTYMKDAMDKVTCSQPARHTRRLELHPSGGRYCPLRDIYDWATTEKSTTEQVTFSSTYFTSVGTLVHEMIQQFTAKGGKVWAYWSCPRCKYESSEIAPYHDCPSCGGETSYRETGFLLDKDGQLQDEKTEDTRLDGHSDALYQDRDGNFWVLDYKTCLLQKARKHKLDGQTLAGNTHYQYQQLCYTTLYHVKYSRLGIKPKGWLLVYLPRDIPFELAFHGKMVTPSEKKAMWESILHDIDALQAVLDAKDYRDIQHLVETKPCKSLDDYRKTMSSPYSECPLKPVCFNDRHLRSALKEALDDNVLLPMREHIKRLTQ